jgi:hypothetical protein
MHLSPSAIEAAIDCWIEPLSPVKGASRRAGGETARSEIEKVNGENEQVACQPKL